MRHENADRTSIVWPGKVHVAGVHGMQRAQAHIPRDFLQRCSSETYGTFLRLASVRFNGADPIVGLVESASTNQRKNTERWDEVQQLCEPVSTFSNAKKSALGGTLLFREKQFRTFGDTKQLEATRLARQQQDRSAPADTYDL
jgi:hypothetical protein